MEPAPKKRKLIEAVELPDTPEWTDTLEFLRWNNSEEKKTSKDIVDQLRSHIDKINELHALLSIGASAWGYSFETLIAFGEANHFQLELSDISSDTAVWRESTRLQNYTVTEIDELLQSNEAKQMTATSCSKLGVQVMKDEHDNLKVVFPYLDYHPWGKRVGRIGTLLFVNIDVLRSELQANPNVVFENSSPLEVNLETENGTHCLSTSINDYGSFGNVARWIKLRKPLDPQAITPANRWESFVIDCFSSC
jgi:hypothetical protein